MGSVSLTEKFLSHKAITPLEKKGLNQYIKEKIKAITSFLKEDYDHLIFTAGTPTTLAFLEKQSSDMNKAHGLILNKTQVSFWLEKLSSLSVEERKKVPFLPEHRSDVIVSGLSLLQNILELTGKKEFIVSATGVRYGLILEKFENSF